MKKSFFLSVALILCFSLFVTAGEPETFSLQELVKIGLENNPDLFAARLTVSSYQEALRSSKKMPNPSLEFHSGRAESYDARTTVNTRGIAVSQYIENPFQRYERIQGMKHNWETEEENLLLQRNGLILQIKTIVYEILLWERNKELAANNLRSMQEMSRLIQKRADLGEVKELEALKLSVEVQRIRNAENEAETRLILLQERLNTLLGINLPLPIKIEDTLFYSPLLSDESSLIQNASKAHPAISGGRAALNRAQSDWRRERWSLFPGFSLSGFSNRELDGTNSGIGVSLELPLWNQNKAGIARADFLLRKAEQELRSTTRLIIDGIKMAYAHLRLAERTISLYDSGLLGQVEQSLHLAEISYREGEISLMDYLDSQRTYYAVIKDHYQALYDWNQKKAALENAVGEELK
ncbi:MAG: TolC family protein [Candidatus Aminicenantes bacterium]|nr:TolC family protein [Candidatus Aminicenantes bacterium]